MPSDVSAAPSLNEKADELFAKILERYPKRGISASSFGKYDGFREWIAREVGLSDWKNETYATGASTTAHNFGSRWSQSNQVAGRRIPLGIGFVQVREPDVAKQAEATAAIIKSVKDTSLKFVDGTRSTSYDAILIFSQLNDSSHIEPQGILSSSGNPIGAKLKSLFPTAEFSEVDRPAEAQGPQLPSVDQTLSLPTTTSDLSSDLPSLAKADFAAANFHVSEHLIRRSVASLIAKPFLILAGLSGSGKTQLALALARWFSTSDLQRQVVAVGSDWTSNQNLIGYPDAFSEEKYVSTPTLDLIVRANSNPTLPFFLILDEMNLSHVERYFSDILSSLESGEKMNLHGSREARGTTPAMISMPRNLFVIGTINVDETTYMFSPKVLDRANVIEFEIDKNALASFLESPVMIDLSAIDARGEAFAMALVEQVTVDASSFTTDEQARYRAEMLLLFEVFDREGFPFAFRTAKEIYRFVEAFKYLSDEEWDVIDAIDAQILQRIMPKLHGDRARLKRILMALGVLCSAKHGWGADGLNTTELVTASNATASTLGDDVPKEWSALLDAGDAQMPLSLRKVIRMLNRLKRDGFTTFIEA